MQNKNKLMLILIIIIFIISVFLLPRIVIIVKARISYGKLERIEEVKLSEVNDLKHETINKNGIEINIPINSQNEEFICEDEESTPLNIWIWLWYNNMEKPK